MAMTTFEQHIEARRAALRVAVPTWQPTALHGQLDACAARFGSRPFVLGDDSTLTYSGSSPRHSPSD
jgi:fatty-acyl-CoA synthase